MTVGKNDDLITPVPPAPFALIIGPGMRRVSARELERAIREMGLRPEPVDRDDLSPAFRLHFGMLSLVARPADDVALDEVDPAGPSISLLATSLPPDWRDGGRCWTFTPEGAAVDGRAAEPRAEARDYLKAMLLLIDLFDASHLFWSPARLWSDAPQFRASIAEMLTSGMPPVLHLVAFRRHDGEGNGTVVTRGLILFAGQELDACIPVGWTVAEMIRRLARLALDMMLHGPFSGDRDLPGLASGERVRLSTVRGGLSTVSVEFGRES